jgi:hypothetical protein
MLGFEFERHQKTPFSLALKPVRARSDNFGQRSVHISKANAINRREKAY